MAEGHTSDPQLSFWEASCGGGAKAKTLLVLILCFCLQTFLVYSDSSDTAPLSSQALEGRRLWHKHGCQTCHQIYGYGGFLGPDLTNAASRLTRPRLDALLTEGSGAMPAFGFKPTQIDAIEAYLGALDKTGQGQARTPASTERQARFLAGIEAGLKEAQGQEALGYTLFKQQGCAACHVLQGASPVGAPELSTLYARLKPEAIEQVLREGRPPRMPKPAFSESEREAVQAFLRWLGERWPALLEGAGSGGGLAWSELPWWEYK